MKTLPALLDDYLTMRRMMGAKLVESERLLRQFVSFLAQRGTRHITARQALEWAAMPQESRPPYRARRLAEVRHFARYAHAIDPVHQVPPEGLLPYGSSRRSPQIYSDGDIVGLVDAARGLSGQLRPLTYATIVALISVTGMRSGEAVGLDRDDVGRRLITVRNGKFGKSRLVPCHDTTCQALEDYAARRDGLWPQPRSDAFFLSEQGKRVSAYTLRETFAKLCRATGLREPGAVRGPRLHDLRHTFAVRALMRWYREGHDVTQRLPCLSTWLGHVSISSTFWYLTAVPELMTAAARHVDRVAAGETS